MMVILASQFLADKNSVANSAMALAEGSITSHFQNILSGDKKRIFEYMLVLNTC